MTPVMPSLLYTPDEQNLRSAVAGALKSHASWPDILRSLDRPGTHSTVLWSVLADQLGVTGLAVDEGHGGSGATWREVAIVVEELGRAVAPVPFLTSAVLATAVLQRLGADASDDLASVAAGQQLTAVVVPWAAPLDEGAVRGWPVTAHEGLVTGSVTAVAGAAEADLLLVPTANGICAVDSAAAIITIRPCLDMTRRIADVVFESAPARHLGGPTEQKAALTSASDLTLAQLSCEQLAVAERCLDMSLEYLMERQQFGRVLGSYQALKHRLADVWTEIVRARATARYATACAAEDRPDLPVAAALAKVVCSGAAMRAAHECLQLHGGIGFTWEHPAHLLVKRARADALALGTATTHLDRLGRLVGIESADNVRGM